MKILYGIQCTGNGHITRSLKVISKLKELGHEVDILLSGKNSDKKLPYNVKYRFNGFTFFNTSKGGINYLKTIMSFRIIQFLHDIQLDVNKYDKVISDFEPITAWSCKLKNKDCYGISNQYSLLNKNVKRKRKNILGELILKWLAPVSNPIGLHFESFVEDNIFMPILSDDILNKEYSDLGHYTVYLPSYSLKKIVECLSLYPNVKFHIFNEDVNRIYQYNNCLIYPIDKKFFIDSFVNCNSIITNSGFQTSSEALYMSKKLMVIPVRGQYEQECNMYALKEMGVFTGTLNDIGEFICSNKNIVSKWIDPIESILNIILN